MKERLRKIANIFSENKKSLLLYSAGILLTIAILLPVTEFYKINWSVPISYGGDTPWTLMGIKSLTNNEWWPFSVLKSPLLATPHTLKQGDFPTTENFLFLILKSLDIFFDDYVKVYNTYILLTFIFSTVVFIYALRKLEVTRGVALVFGILFAFLPFHFWRIAHLFLSSYFLIPLFIVALTWLWDDELIFFKKDEKIWKINIWNKKAIFTIVTSILIGSSGIYYAFFFCFFSAIAGISAYFYQKKSIRHALSAFIIIFLTSFTLLFNLIPGIVFQIENGENPLVGKRHPQEAEVYGLKITNMMLPLGNHRIPLLRMPTQFYFSYNNVGIEGSNEYIGFIALLGIIFLLARIFVREKETLNDRYSILLISGILFATVGGFSSLFALVVSPAIRGYNRISVILATLGLFAGALFVNQCMHRIKKYQAFLILTLILSIGLFDQTVASMRFSQGEKAEFISDKNFVQEIEKKLPKGSMIFQFPFAPFPEIPPINDMVDYSHFKGYLHSDTLKWTYGGVKGRPESIWYENMANLEITELLKKLTIADFEGIYIDRYGYQDRAQLLEGELKNILQEDPIESINKRLSFFSLGEYKRQLQKQFSKEELNKQKELIIHPVITLWKEKCSGLEGDKEYNWRWCGSEGKLVLHNFGKENRKIKLNTTFSTGYEENSTLNIKSTTWKEKLIIDGHGKNIEKVLIIPTGDTVIYLTSNAERLIAETDPRELVFRVINFTLSYNEN